MTRSRHDFTPLIPLEEPVYDRMVKGMSHAIFQGLFDLGCSCDLSCFSPLEERLQEDAFLLPSHVLVSPSTCSRPQDAFKTGSGVGRNPIVHTVNRDPCMKGYLFGRSRIAHRIHDYQQFSGCSRIRRWFDTRSQLLL